jgi:MoaA/NifB/PqqE/SkfB family radical SAM enzyme
MRKRVLEILADAAMPGADDILVQGLMDPDETVWGRAAEVLTFRYPWLVLEAAKPGGVPAPGWRRYRFGPAWSRLRGALAQWAQALPPEVRVPVGRFARIPAILPELIQALAAAGRHDEARRVERYLHEERQLEGLSRQVLFATTYACNLRCPYCYVKEWEQRFAGEMSIDSFRTALDWCQRQGVNWIIFGGGEPTVHRRFGALIDETRRRGMPVSLTSNGLFGQAVRECLKPPAIPEFICHVEQEILLHDARRSAVMRDNLAAALKAGVAVRIRYTLTDQSDSGERRAILEVARSFGIRTVNYGFAFQSVDGNNEFFAHGGSAEATFDDRLNRFMDEAVEAGVELHLSKPFPLCHLKPSTLRRAVREGGLRSACTAWRRGYSMNLTVNPDLTTLPCNAIGRAGPRITEFKDFAEAGRFHAATLKPLFDHPWKPRCRHCILFHRGICQGVCLAEHYSARAAAPRQEGGRA